ncbi:MAG: hypothetical protein NTW96_02775 [Planctomycetia bacterium]|nr:hypothetical protein [Planctomycetia bacterium]
MKRRSWFIGPSIIALVSTILFAAAPQRPNFVFILGEGHGWSSTSVRMDDAAPGSKSDYVRSDRSVAHSYSILSGRQP